MRGNHLTKPVGFGLEGGGVADGGGVLLAHRAQFEFPIRNAPLQSSLHGKGEEKGIPLSRAGESTRDARRGHMH